MSWLRGNLRWRVQFKSLSGKGCLVNIYDRGYSGGFADLSKTGNDVPFAVEQGVTALQGASDCFYYDEDDEKDFLQFLRVKTGFLRLVEETYGALDNLQPSQPMEHYVEVYYGANIVFTGYMQCADYSSPFVACPRVLEYVITSPLGFLDSQNFSVDNLDNNTVTLGKALQEVIAGLDSRYNRVVWPGSTVAPWNSLVPTSLLVPFNEEFVHTDDANKIYKPQDFRFFLAGICSYFGWVLHDSPTTLFFTKYDQPLLPDKYSSILVANLANPQEQYRTDLTQSSPFSLLANYSNADNNASFSVLRPLKKLDVTMDGDPDDGLSLTTRHCKVDTIRFVTGNGYMGCSLQQVTNEVDGYGIGVAQWNGTSILTPGLYPIMFTTFGSTDTEMSFREFWVAVIDNSNASLRKKLISWKKNGCFDVSANSDHGNIVGVRIHIAKGTNLETLKSSGWGSNIQLQMSIRNGDKYYNFANSTWQSQEVPTTVTFDKNTGKLIGNQSLPDYSDVDGYILYLNDEEPYDFEVNLYYNSINGTSTGNHIAIETLELFDPLRGMSDFGLASHNENGRTFTIDGNNKGVEEGNVSVGMNSCVKYKGNTSFVNADGSITGLKPSFPYVFKPSSWLTQQFKGTMMTNEYIYQWRYYAQDWIWKVMAHGFDLASDTHTLTLARSVLLNNQNT